MIFLVPDVGVLFDPIYPCGTNLLDDVAVGSLKEYV